MRSTLKTVDDSFSNEIRCYYEVLAKVTIHEELHKLLKKAAKEIANEIMDKYKLEQQLVTETELGKDKQIILTTVLRKVETKTPKR